MQFPSMLALAVSLYFPAIPAASPPTETATCVRLLNAERRHQGVPPARPAESGAEVARLAVARLAVTGERPPERDGWALAYYSGTDATGDAIAAWAAVFRPGHGPFDPLTAEVAYHHTGINHAMAYQQATPPAPEPTAGTPMAAPAEMRPVAGDRWGFTAWLNGQRAMLGLSSVGWDSSLADWAVRNSAVGFGHAVRMGRVQNSGVGDLWAVCNMWLGSPAHAAALFDPTITSVGIGVVGSTWTFNGN